MQVSNLALAFKYSNDMEETQKGTKKVTVTMKSWVMDNIQELAKEENRSFSNMVETACLKYLTQQNQKEA